MTHEELDLDDDLEITKATRRHSGGGIWVRGILAGHSFEALVFADHAEVAAYELEESRISKLLIRRAKDRQTTYHWDRGLVLPAADELTQSIVDLLVGGLADCIYPE